MSATDNVIKPRGTTLHRFAIYFFTTILTILVYWLLGFVIKDINSVQGPSFEAIEKSFVDQNLKEAIKKIEGDINRTKRQIEAKKAEQAILRDGTQSIEKTINQLMELQRTSIQQKGMLSDAEQKAFNTSMNMFLENQKQDQAITQEIAKMVSHLNELEGEKQEKQEIVEKQLKPAYEYFNRKIRIRHITLAVFELIFLIPLLVICGWVILKYRSSIYFYPLLAICIATLVRTMETIHRWFPSRIFRYLLIFAAIVVVTKILISFIKQTLKPSLQWLLKQYKEAYELFFCPVCGYPIRRGPMRYLFWTRRSLARIASSIPNAGNVVDSRYICPHCGTSLYEECNYCHFIRHSLLPYCEHCGDKKEITASTSQKI